MTQGSGLSESVDDCAYMTAGHWRVGLATPAGGVAYRVPEGVFTVSRYALTNVVHKLMNHGVTNHVGEWVDTHLLKQTAHLARGAFERRKAVFGVFILGIFIGRGAPRLEHLVPTGTLCAGQSNQALVSGSFKETSKTVVAVVCLVEGGRLPLHRLLDHTGEDGLWVILLKAF